MGAKCPATYCRKAPGLSFTVSCIRYNLRGDFCLIYLTLTAMASQQPLVLTPRSGDILAVCTGLEPVASCVTGKQSNQLI